MGRSQARGNVRRGWKKLHLGVDASGTILAQGVTESSGDDAQAGLDLMDVIDSDIAQVTADAAYDTVAIYESAAQRGAKVVVPPARTASVSKHGRRSVARDSTLRRVKKIGRRQWKKESGYHRQGTVEKAFFRYK